MKASNRWILVLEDDEDDMDLTRRALKRVASGLRVEVATDGEGALEVLSRPDIPSLVLMDAHMPRVSGVNLLHRALALPGLRAVPFVVFSSSIGPQEQRALLAEGAREVLIKPLEYDDYTRSLSRVVGTWLTPNE